MPSVGSLLSLVSGLPTRASSGTNAELTGDISGLGAISAASLAASGAVQSGSLAVSGNADISGSLDLSGALTGSSSASFAGALDAASAVISGNLDVSGSFDLSGAAVMSNTLNVGGAVTLTSSLNVSGDSQFAADVMVSGDLSVNGKIISRLQTDVVIKDTYLDLAFGNSTSGTSSVASQAGGFTVGQARNTNFTAGAVSDFPSSSTFTYANTGSSTPLAAGDVVAISGLPAELAENEGYFVVASVSGASFPQTVTIETSLQQSLAWAQTAFTVGTPQAAGEAFKPNLSILAVADGTAAYKSGAGAAWPVGTLVLASYIGGGANGATKALFQANGAYVAVGAGSTTLQNAYENGEVITTDSTHGNVQIAGDQALVVSASGGVDIGATLDVSGALTVDGAADLNSTLDVAGAATFASTVDISGAADISGALTVSGAAIMQSTLTANGAVDFDSTLDVSGALTVDGAADLNSTLNVGGHAEFESSVDVSGALAVSGAASMQSTLDVSGALTLDGAADFNSTLNVQAGGTFQSTVDISGALTLDGAADFNSTLNVQAGGTFQSTVDISGALTLDGAADFNSTLDVQGHAEFQSSVDISGALTVDGEIVADQMEVVSLGVECTAGEALSAGHIVVLNGGTKQVVKALADDAVAAPLRRGWAISRDAVSSAAQGYMIIDGFATVLFEGGSATGSAGAPVFLSAATAGTAVLSAPSAAGNAVMQIGFLAQDVSAAASGLIALEKQFVAQIPA